VRKDDIEKAQQVYHLLGLSRAGVVSEHRRAEGKDAEQSQSFGRACMMEGDFIGAIAHFRRAIKQAGSREPEILEDLAGALAASDQAPEALRWLARARRERLGPDTRLAASAIFRFEGRADKAIGELQQAIDEDPENPYLHLKLAETLRGLGRRRQAVEPANQARMLDPEDPHAHQWTGELLLELGDFEEAESALRSGLELRPTDHRALQMIAVAQWGQRRHSDALRSLRVAIEISENEPAYGHLLALFLNSQGHDEDAAEERRRAGEMNDFDRDLLERMVRPLERAAQRASATLPASEG
jgi:tetratricopeptide (TPR) repeat protein